MNGRSWVLLMYGGINLILTISLNYKSKLSITDRFTENYFNNYYVLNTYYRYQQ